MTSKLEVYNDALLFLGERKLTSLTEAREPRRALDDVWDKGLRFCLEQGLWNFAVRAVQADSSASITPTFGYQYAFVKPDDWVRTYSMSADDRMNTPLIDYSDEPDLWYANVDPIFIKYISDDNAYGLDLSRWPETFATYVAARLARRICRNISQSESLYESLAKEEERARRDAKAKDALNDPPDFPPTGTWVRSRRGWYSTNNSDRGLG